jgi:class 3 adenylate cyclase
VLLFTDLKNSTALYETHGDASAFSFVQAHFDILITIIGQHQGGIVKTIGDAVMAAFNSPSDAVQAGLSILHHFTHYNQQHPAETHLSIKLGLHCGPCILLNLNERLDYFGSTVNIAARIEGMSKGDDMVLSSKLYEIDEVQTLLAAESDIIIAPFSAHLKGIHDEQQLYRIALR